MVYFWSLFDLFFRSIFDPSIVLFFWKMVSKNISKNCQFSTGQILSKIPKWSIFGPFLTPFLGPFLTPLLYYFFWKMASKIISKNCQFSTGQILSKIKMVHFLTPPFAPFFPLFAHQMTVIRGQKRTPSFAPLCPPFAHQMTVIRGQKRTLFWWSSSTPTGTFCPFLPPFCPLLPIKWPW